VQATGSSAASGQGHIERLGGKLCQQRGFAQCGAARLKLGLDGGLGGIDRSSRLAPGFGIELAERLQSLRQRTTLAEIARLGLLELRAVCRGGEIGDRLLNQLIQVFHVRALPGCNEARCFGVLRVEPNSEEKKGGQASFFRAAFDYAASLARACSAIAAKAGLSNTARSARTLRSTSIAAFFRPFMKVL